MALGGAALRSTTMLEQLLEEINFQRTKEMRQLLKDESGFVVLQGTTYWTDLFVRHFLFQEEPARAIDCDDLLFFVRKRHVRGSSRRLPKYETDVEVFRKDSKKLPIGDPEIDWEETVYLNLIVHQFEYTLTLAICTRTSPKELQVLKRHSQKVYASPSRRKMDTKGEGEEMTYPHVCFMVDNFDEVFCDIVVRDGEMVCVELVAGGRGAGGAGGGGGGGGGAQAVIFLGSIRYDALTRVYDSRQTSLSTKVAQRMSFGLLGGAGAGAGGCGGARCEFVRMKGPDGKGHAEMAVSRARGAGHSGLDTPCSEPGLAALDGWDSDFDDDPDEMFLCRNQRRLSDPSANLAHFARGGWQRKERERARDKAHSESEGLDALGGAAAEVQAGDVRDERAAQASSGRGSGRGRERRARDVTRRHDVTRHVTAAPMKELYKRPPGDVSSPACLHTVTPRRRSARAAPGPPPLRPLPQTPSKKPQKKTVQIDTECEIADDAASLDECDISCDTNRVHETLRNPSCVTVRGEEELPCCREYLHPRARNCARRDSNGNEGDADEWEGCGGSAGAGAGGGARAYCTLPRRHGGLAAVLYKNRPPPPRRTTPDGTDIYYWCDVPKRKLHELDDGAYNPLWAMRGFTQTFHLWKEGKRQQSAPLTACLTYVTLPWWSIAKDILDHREEPILTF